MQVTNYYNYTAENNALTFSREAASTFAKEVAGDFNPIHNPDARRFCVPGDLLFAVVLDQYRTHASMHFDFEQMVDDRVSLGFQVSDNTLRLTDTADKSYLNVSFCGDTVESVEANQALIAAYVRFSGQTFPFLLVDLMQQHQVMINPARPLVIYKSMSIELQRTDCDGFDLEFTESSLKADGKKGEVTLNFNIVSGESVVGSGQKNMLLGGLRAYDQQVVDELVADYNAIKSQYQCERT